MTAKIIKPKEVVHYHKDTEVIHDTLVKSNAYNTSKGHGIYKGRSQSNGKLMFKSTENPLVNIYFTKKEWIDGNNTPKNVDKDYTKKATAETVKEARAAVTGLVEGKTRLKDISFDCFGNTEALYLGFNQLYGIYVEYKDSGKTRVYYSGTQFKKRFEIIEVGVADPKPFVIPTPDSGKKTKKRKK